MSIRKETQAALSVLDKIQAALEGGKVKSSAKLTTDNNKPIQNANSVLNGIANRLNARQ